MWRRAAEFQRADHENEDSGAETAESDCSRMSSTAIELLTRQVKQQQLLLISLHLLANPGDSLLLQQTVDRLLHWLCPSLRIFHVSERACPFRAPNRLCSVAGYPSLAITFFLHEAYGEERILKVLDFLQHPPWQYHHTESCGSRTGGIHITSNGSSSNPLLRPYLLPSRDFYSLGAGMPVWGVRPVHCGGEILRITLYSSYDNYEDAVRLYETVLQRQAEEQKTGFCWFTIHTEPGLSLQLALKQLSPGVRVEPCSSAVLQFSVEEVGQLVPLLPNPCTPISTTRWQTEDLDGNKVLFQVKTPGQPQRPLTSAFPLTCLSMSTRGLQVRNSGPTTPPSWQSNRQGNRPRSDPVLEKLYREGGGAESLRSGSCCSTPPGSSCYSSQRSSPAHLSTPNHPDSPLHLSTTHSLSHLHLEEEEEDEEESETNVDTGVAVCPITRSSSIELLKTVHPERPAAVGAKSVEELANKQIWTVPLSRTHVNPHKPSGGRDDAALENRSAAAGQSPSNRLLVENRTTAEPLSARTNNQEPVEEFFI